ncbi:Sorting nexin, cytoplasm-to-vacuole targeting pathway/endosomal sorting [Coemansia guatemalensis]|uniref:Sorting nexin, cytoplasm-to-vacuole targeting pathway/endosomal sorting n=1 Tax=Coemansia guatemalensis TaxID=2761395 RepID=A0A9W8I1K5_9FUNG|nr:Sorting nexin, cytoplasm-to-vacuole targeting pathway/endosomal sorting [Coemansia guatemalensis]
MTDADDYCCGIDRYLHELLDDAKDQRRRSEDGGEYQAPQLYHVVHIGDAEKMSESGSSFIAYTITFGEYEVKRRYSEFESLRNCLCRLYPTFIVPPIPEKHSLAQYAVLQKRAKEDQYIIERRKRMLEHFVNHLAEHPILSSEHIVHRFLESGVSWTEVLHSPVITSLPKTPLHSSPSRAPGSSVADGMAAQLPKIAATNSYAGDVPVPSTLAPIKNIEARWMDCELFTNKYANQFTGVIEKNERRIYRKLGELSSDYAELGATLNGFSLLEHPERLAVAIERAGQAVDNSYIETGQLLSQMEAEVSEPIHTYSQYSLIVKQVLRFRLLKNLQLENVEEALVRQRAKLEELLQADDEAKRLAQALDSGGHAPAAQRGDSAGAAQRERGYSISDRADEVESLLSDGTQQHGFVTPQRANTDASSMHGGATAGRSRGPSVASAMSTGAHGEFTPTLAPRSIPESSAGGRSPALHPSSVGAQHRTRSRTGTATSTASAATNRRGSNGWGDRAAGDIGSGRGGRARPSDLGTAGDDNDDPLAQFQQEESQLWGGGAGSTLPRLGARSRSAQRQQQQHNGRRSSQMSDDQSPYGIYPHQSNMAQSEYIGQASSRNAMDNGDMAASTPALWEAPSEGFVSDEPAPAAPYAAADNSQRPPQPGAMSSSSTSTSSNASLGARLLRSPKAIGDSIMNRLTYALNGMMDVDPEQMRHNQIGRASDKISVLEEQLEMLSNDLTLINTSTQDNLDRFQKQKVRDLKGVLVSMAKMHLEWAEKNLEIWNEAKLAVDEV